MFKTIRGGKLLNIFKSRKKADTILHNGHIYSDYEISDINEALAIKDEKIIAIGVFESMEELIGDETLIIDLKGKHVFPGFIQTDKNYVNEVFFKEYVHLDEEMNVTEIMDAIDGMSYFYDDRDIIFAHGYGDDTFKESSSNEITNMLDSISKEKPVLLVAENNMECLYNTYAKNIILETAEEEMVEIITLPYILNLLIPYDFDQVLENVMEINEESKDKGFTTLFNAKSPYFFDEGFENALLDLYNEENLKFKYQGSFYANRAYKLKYIKYILGKLRTNCSELLNYIEHEVLFIDLNKQMSEEWIDEIINYCGEINIKIQIKCYDKEDLNKLEKVLSKRRINDNKSVVIYNDHNNSELLDVIKTSKDDFTNTEEMIKYQTEEAAERIGKEDEIGVIKEGYIADIAIFSYNPLEMTPQEFIKEDAVITIINGKIVHDEQKDRDDEWYDIFSKAPL